MPIRPVDPRKMNEDDEALDVAGSKDIVAASKIDDPAVLGLVIIRADVDADPIQG